jgi:hypothetical protein
MVNSKLQRDWRHYIVPAALPNARRRRVLPNAVFRRLRH